MGGARALGFKLKTMASAILCSLALSSCCFFYQPIPPTEFRVEQDDRNLELHVTEMSRGTHRTEEDGAIVVRLPSGDTHITFSVRSEGHQGRLVAHVGAGTGIKGAMVGVATTYGFRGGLWLASYETYNRWVIRGVEASRSSFLVGRWVRNDENKFIEKIEKVAPDTGMPLFPKEAPGIVVEGRGGASLYARSFAFPGERAEIYARSSVLIEQGDSTQVLKVPSVLPLEAVMQPGPVSIRWTPSGSDESHVDVTMDAASNEARSYRWSFSSMR